MNGNWREKKRSLLRSFGKKNSQENVEVKAEERGVEIDWLMRVVQRVEKVFSPSNRRNEEEEFLYTYKMNYQLIKSYKYLPMYLTEFSIQLLSLSRKLNTTTYIWEWWSWLAFGGFSMKPVIGLLYLKIYS